jgi:hypothetical protein
VLEILRSHAHAAYGEFKRLTHTVRFTKTASR